MEKYQIISLNLCFCTSNFLTFKTYNYQISKNIHSGETTKENVMNSFLTFLIS